jgi:(1->4)-alpha-D-glucan 1-alpha-D-glucosylmutase
MGLIVDFVPNHMGIGMADNAWWLDVLEWGEASPHAAFFDIDWQPAKPDLRGKVLLPALGDQYGAVLERGELKLAFDEAGGTFSVWYYEHRFPVSPLLYATLLGPGLERLRARRGDDEALRAAVALVEGFRALRAARATAAGRAGLRAKAAALETDLARLAAADPQLRAALVDEALSRVNGTPGEPQSFRLLHWLLERQAYRLAYWRVAADEINYRRFFDINDLAGVRVEVPRLFDAMHALVLRLHAEGKIDGLRLDHIDGLYEPRAYCRRLNEAVAERGGRPLYLVVEKILARHETLRDGWPIAGTTGYETLNLINGLFVRPEAERALDRAYARFVGARATFDEVLHASKTYVLDKMLASERNVLAHQLDRLSEANWRTRDFTLAGISAALNEVTVCFPVYRTYVTSRRVEAEDHRDIEWAVGQARKRAPDIDSALFDLVQAALTTELVRARRSGYNRAAVVRFAMRFQQFTGPVTAKAMEDTAFYRYVRFVALNEVGGDPRRFGLSIAAFHHLNQERARHWPHALVTTATHDTKRGEDMRARLDVLSEMSDAWARQARRWSAFNRRAKVEVDGEMAPSANDEYLLYQTIVGAWPMALLDEAEPDAESYGAFAERICAYAVKAAREAKLRTSWAAPDAAYEEALTGFVRRLLDPARGAPFLADARGFARAAALPGALNGLSQALLKLTVPGVPDIYQGCEMWDLSLVDPDNRRPVDYPARIAALEALDGAAPRRLLESWRDGRIKLHVVSRLLALRQREAALFRDGAYLPLTVSGAQADRICAFARVADGRACLVVAPRFFVGLIGEGGAAPLGEAWGDSVIALPDELAGRTWEGVLDGRRFTDAAATISVATLLAELPVATLASSQG